MNVVNNVVINAATNTGTVLSAAIPAQFFTSMSAQAVFSDAAAAGVFKLECSDDPSNTGVAPTHWNDVPLITATVASGAVTMLTAPTICYQWVRVSWARSGGAGTVTVRIKALEAA